MRRATAVITLAAIVFCGIAGYAAWRKPLYFLFGGVLAISENPIGYGRFAARELTGRIVWIEYQPHVSTPGVRITDPAMIAEVRRWLLGAKRPGIASWPGANCDLLIAMNDGRKIRLKISITDQQFAGYAMVKWGGFHRIGPHQPFSDILFRMRGPPAASSGSIEGAGHSEDSP